jgi:hypothetical protein
MCPFFLVRCSPFILLHGPCAPDESEDHSSSPPVCSPLQLTCRSFRGPHEKLIALPPNVTTRTLALLSPTDALVCFLARHLIFFFLLHSARVFSLLHGTVLALLFLLHGPRVFLSCMARCSPFFFSCMALAFFSPAWHGARPSFPPAWPLCSSLLHGTVLALLFSPAWPSRFSLLHGAFSSDLSFFGLMMAFIFTLTCSVSFGTALALFLLRHGGSRVFSPAWRPPLPLLTFLL